MSNSKISVKDKLYAVKRYLDGKKSQHQIAEDTCIWLTRS